MCGLGEECPICFIDYVLSYKVRCPHCGEEMCENCLADDHICPPEDNDDFDYRS